MLIRQQYSRRFGRKVLRPVLGNALAIRCPEQRKDLARLGMTAGLGLRVQHLSIDDDVEDAPSPMYERRLGNDVLVALEKVFGRAHGVTRIVSTNAVFDADFVPCHAFRIVSFRLCCAALGCDSQP